MSTQRWNPARKGIDCERRIIGIMRGLLEDVLARCVYVCDVCARVRA